MHCLACEYLHFLNTCVIIVFVCIYAVELFFCVTRMNT